MSQEFIKVKDLRPDLRRINVKVKVVNKAEIREVVSRRDYSKHRVTDALVGDETGSVLLTLWNDDIEKFNVGEVIKIENGYMTTFRGSMRLNIGRYGTAEKITEEIAKVNTENNLSEKYFEEGRPQYSNKPYRKGLSEYQ